MIIPRLTEGILSHVNSIEQVLIKPCNKTGGGGEEADVGNDQGDGEVDYHLPQEADGRAYNGGVEFFEGDCQLIALPTMFLRSKKPNYFKSVPPFRNSKSILMYSCFD